MQRQVLTDKLNAPISSRKMVALAVHNGIAPYLVDRVLTAVNQARDKTRQGSSQTYPTNANLLALSFHGGDVTRSASTSYWGDNKNCRGLGKSSGRLIAEYLEAEGLLEVGIDYRNRHHGSAVSKDFVLVDAPELD